jgi:serine/threonine-protein kinase HipA
MPLANGAGPYVFNDFGQNVFMGLPGVFADSLPDGFGNTLISEHLRRMGVSAASITALDRLAYIGTRGIGALCYEPERGPHGGKPLALDMRKLTEEARKALNGSLEKMSGNDALRQILRVGVSAGGGKSKAVVGWNRETNQFLAGDRDLPDGFEHWIIKFTPPEYPYRGRCEYKIMQKARAAGIATSECRIYELDGLEHFMTRRFDRDGQTRYHVQTLAALAHLPTGMGSDTCSYDHIFSVIDDLRLGYETKEQMFRRMAYNVLADESDDHTKNFSFLVRENGRWELAPAYDLNGGAPEEAEETLDPWCGWHDFHAIKINGKQSKITDDDMLAVADRFAIGTAPRVLEEVRSVLSRCSKTC